MKKLPLPIAGLMLGLAGLGNLLASHWIGFRYIAGLLSFLIGLMLIVQIVGDFAGFKKQMKNPVIASVFPTFSMAFMILAGYISKWQGFAKFIWYLAIGLHIILMVFFTKNHLMHLKIENVYAGYFIVYVGICVASLTAPAFDNLALGQAIFYFSFLALIVFLGLVGYRYATNRQIDEGLRPLFSIFAAPTSLCLAGYVASFPEGSKNFALFLTIMSKAIFFFVIIRGFSLFKLSFYPSFSAFTFPFVISAIGLKMANGKYFQSPLLETLILLETAFVTIMVIRVFLGYVKFLRKDK